MNISSFFFYLGFLYRYSENHGLELFSAIYLSHNICGELDDTVEKVVWFIFFN